MSLIRKCDTAIMFAIGLILVATVILGLADPLFFTLVFAAEDGPVEYGTALFLLIASGVLAVHAASLWRG